MAIPSTHSRGEGGTEFRVFTFTGNDSGIPVSVPGLKDRTIQVFGTFDGATITLKGSCEPGTPTTYFTLTDVIGTPIAFTSADGAVITEAVMHLQPVVTNAGASTDLTVIIMFR